MNVSSGWLRGLEILEDFVTARCPENLARIRVQLEEIYRNCDDELICKIVIEDIIKKNVSCTFVADCLRFLLRINQAE
jgi:hypothetical protein